MLAQLRQFRQLVRSHPFAARSPAGAWGRFVWWQVRSRLFGRTMVIPYVNGSRLEVSRGRPASTAVWYVGLPDYDEMMFALHLLRPGDVFVDGGSNVGVWAVTAAAAGATVVAVEPVAATREVLLRQVALNGYQDRIRCPRCALVDVPGEVRLTSDRDVGNKVVTGSGDPNSEPVPGETLDRVCAADRPVLIKLDLEGGELAALKGGAAVLADPTLLAVVVETFRPHNWQTENLQEIERVLADHGFLPYRYDPGRRRLTPLAGPADGGQNTIYARSAAAVGARLESAPAATLAARPL